MMRASQCQSQQPLIALRSFSLRPSNGLGRFRAVIWMLGVGSIVLGSNHVATVRADEPPATWDFAQPGQVQRQVDGWLEDQVLSASQQRAIEQIWLRPLVASGQPGDAAPLFDAVIETISVALPKSQASIRRAQHGELSSLAEIEGIEMEALPRPITDNLRLLFGKSLALSQLYDDAQLMLAGARPENVADPAALLFYRAVTHYRLRQKDDGLASLALLMERQAELPARYANLARLMHVDLQRLEDDSLDEVARIMDSIKVRLGHGQAGTRVRREEQEVVDKLDKMIEQLEEQLQQMQLAMGGNAGGLQSNAPAQDSMLPGGAQGQGDVDSKQLGQNVDWGNMPPKQREEAIQQLGKDFPSHYREIIEEYFRKLAQESPRAE